jgi:predicted transcriptional regulator
VKRRNISYQSDDDGKLARSLAAGGVREPAARVMVFPGRHPAATAYEIELGTDMSQPQMSFILNYMKGQGRVMSRGKRGRGHRLQFFLSRPFPEFVGDVIRGRGEKAARDREIVRR